MVAFPKVGFAFKLRCKSSPVDYTSSRMVVSRIIESGEQLREEQVLRFYGLRDLDLVTTNTLARLSIFVRPRVLFWDFTNNRYRIYPWDAQTAKRIWERLVPIGQTDPETVPAVESHHVRPIIEKKLKALEKITTGSSELTDLFSDEIEAKEKPTVTWAEHAKVVTELSALKATLRKHFPSLKFD